MQITLEQVLRVNQPPMGTGAPRLWEHVQRLIQDAGERGYLPSGEATPDAEP